MKGRILAILTHAPAFLFTIICLLAILWLTIAPHPIGDNELELFPGADKIVHAIMFGGLTWCMLLDIQRRRWQKLRLSQYILAIALSTLAGFITEWLQYLTDLGRSYDPLDLCADATGAILFALLYLPIGRWLNNH